MALAGAEGVLKTVIWVATLANVIFSFLLSGTASQIYCAAGWICCGVAGLIFVKAA